MITAIYPGTFDPITNGHVDVATRAADLFDQLIVGVYDRPIKTLLFSTHERVAMAEQALSSLPNVRVQSYGGLTINFARRVEARVIVRGLRVLSDFELEFQMALTNCSLASEIETVCLMARQEHAFLSSSVVKEIAMVGGAIDEWVPQHVVEQLKNRFRQLGSEAGSRVRIVSLRD
jgi:pantetheine-phosphate adenylyltransferase